MLALFASLAVAGTLQIDMLDVGQGDAILLRSPAGKTVLIDGGTGEVSVPPMLDALGVRSLDLVIATHPHADHIGGLDAVLEAMPVRIFLDSGQVHTTATYNDLMDLVEQQGMTYRTAHQGQVFNLDDGITIELLGPPDNLLSGTRSDLNSNSVVARVTHDEDCFLFTGDAEEPTERLLLQRGIAPCGVLKVAHHGSSHSTTDAWLRSVQPEIALISVGEGNRYGHPAEETLDRLERHGAAIYRTDLHGTIHLESDGQGVTVTVEAPPEPLAMAAPAEPAPAEPVPAHSGDRIVLNTASQTDLESISGIGPSRAAAIIAWRDEHGHFQSFEELEHISGIGPKTRQVISEQAVLGP